MPQLDSRTDALQQERIRRGPHVYDRGPDGKMTYIAVAPQHYEYPKVMDKTPMPKIKDFKGKPDAQLLLENAITEWDEGQRLSIVHNKTEEEAWLSEHKDDQIVNIADRRYPKTMDKTPPPSPSDFNDLESFREAKAAWKEQITKSIVHDKDEEDLWLRQNQAPVSEPVAAAGGRRGRRG